MTRAVYAIGVSDGHEALCIGCVGVIGDDGTDNGARIFHAQSDDIEIECDRCGVNIQQSGAHRGVLMSAPGYTCPDCGYWTDTGTPETSPTRHSMTCPSWP